MRLVILCQKAMPWGILKSRIRMMEVTARKFHFCPCLGNQHWILFNWPWFLFIMIAMRSVTRRRRLLLCTVPPRRRQGVAVCMSAADTLIQNTQQSMEELLITLDPGITVSPWINICPIHVVTFTLISHLATDFIQKRRSQALLFSFMYNLSPSLISK